MGQPAADLAALHTPVAPMVVDPLQSDEFAKRFDLLMVRLQIATVRAELSLARQIDAVQKVAKGLKKKGNLPVVQAQRPLIDALLRDEFWQTVGLSALEAVRVALRELVKLIDRGGKAPVCTDFEDAWFDTIVVGEFRQNYGYLSGVEDRLRTIIREHADNLTIRKLHRNEPITGDELDHLDSFLFAESAAETRDAYRLALGEKPLGVFIRSIVGLDLHAAKTAFAGLLSNGPLNPRQQKFIDELIDRLQKNGLVERAQLAARPFTDLHSQGVIGLFPKDYPRILNILEDVEERAKVG